MEEIKQRVRKFEDQLNGFIHEKAKTQFLIDMMQNFEEELNDLGDSTEFMRQEVRDTWGSISNTCSSILDAFEPRHIEDKELLSILLLDSTSISLRMDAKFKKTSNEYGIVYVYPKESLEHE